MTAGTDTPAESTYSDQVAVAIANGGQPVTALTKREFFALAFSLLYLSQQADGEDFADSLDDAITATELFLGVLEITR